MRSRIAVWAALAVFLLLGAGLVLALPGRQPATALPEQAPATTPQVLDSPVPAQSYSIDGEQNRIHLGLGDLRQAVAAGLVPEDTRSILRVDEKMRHGQFVWQDDNKATGPLTVWVDLDRQLVSAYRGGHEIGTSVILYGAEGHASPTGVFPILRKNEDYHSRAYDAPMPYSLWLTDDGVALHGSDVRWGRATHGCIGVPVDFARRLFEIAGKGDVVRIIRSSQIVAANSNAAGATAG